jgi:hypothetical protein
MHAQRCESCKRRRCSWRRAEGAADGVRPFGHAPALWKPCPCTVLVHSPDFGFQTLRLASPSPPPVTTRLPSGVKAPQVTGPWCPVSTWRRPRRPSASEDPGVPKTTRITCMHMHMHARACMRGTAGEPRLHAGARRRVPHPCRKVLAAGEHDVAARVPGKPLHSVARPLQAVDAPACGSVPNEDAPCTAPGHHTWAASARQLSPRRKEAARAPSRPPDARRVPATLNASELTCAALQRCSPRQARVRRARSRAQAARQPCTSLNAPSRCDPSALLLQRFALLQSPAPGHLAPSSTRGLSWGRRHAWASRAAPATGRPCRRRRQWQPGLLEQSSRQPQTPRLRRARTVQVGLPRALAECGGSCKRRKGGPVC